MYIIINVISDATISTRCHNLLQLNVGVVVISAVPYLPERREGTALTANHFSLTANHYMLIIFEPSGPRYMTKVVGCHVKEISAWTANLRSLRHLPLASKTKWLRAVEAQPRPQGHLCGCGEKKDDPGKGCPNLLVHWLTHSTSQGL